MNFPATKRAKIYRKPGVYLSGPLLDAPWRNAAVAELAIAPSELLASVLDIGLPCLSRAASSLNVAANAQCRKKQYQIMSLATIVQSDDAPVRHHRPRHATRARRRLVPEATALAARSVGIAATTRETTATSVIASLRGMTLYSLTTS